MTAEWLLLEERRMYEGATHEEAAAAARTGLSEAITEGYVAERVAWSDDGRMVTVEYVYDPARAGRPV